MLIETLRLRLRPLRMADTPAVARTVFGDPQVACMLAHNTADPADAMLAAERWTSKMGEDGGGKIWADGGIGLFAVTPRSDPERLAGIAGFYMEPDSDGIWSGEYFYALGRDWHGQGLMSEAAAEFRRLLETHPGIGVIYGCYWDLINEHSGRILNKSGLLPAGRKPVTKEYPPERCRRIFEYDLWRVSGAKGTPGSETTLIQAARRAGAFVAEGVVEPDDALSRLAEAAGHALPPSATTMFDRAIETPGMAYVEYRRPDVRSAPVNRLG